MELFCVIFVLICVGPSVAMINPDQRPQMYNDIASTSLIQQILERERQTAKQDSEILFLKAEMSQQASEIQSLKAEMSQQASEIQSLKAEMSQQGSEIQSLKAEMSQQGSEIKTMKAEMSQQASEIQSLKAEMSQQASEIQSLKAEMSQQASEIQSLEAAMSQQRGIIRKLSFKFYAKVKLIQTLLRKSAVVEPVSRNGRISTEINHTETHERQQTRNFVNRIQPIENIPVAFSASLTHSILHVSGHQNIAFDHVGTNVGNAYDRYSGNFTAPVPGIYVFTTSLLNNHNGSTYAFMTVNSEIKSMLYMKDDYREMVSQTMVFQLDQGDVVAIKGFAGNTYYGNGPTSPTTFSGFLLQQMYPSSPIFG